MVGSIEGPSVRAKRPTWVVRKWAMKMDLIIVEVRGGDRKRRAEVIELA